MTATFLQTELSNLITDSKRKHTDVRTAAEKSLADLRGISVTSETQLAGDLSRRPYFVDPFTLACHTKNAKLISTAAACLQRLIASRAVARSKLGDVLAAFDEVSNNSYEVQLKILQTLPALLQLYSADVHGELLTASLGICATLQLSKTNLVNKSASATFYQLITTVFEKASNRKNQPVRRPTSPKKQDSGEDDDHDEVTTDDAQRLFEDFCALLNRNRPKYLHFEDLSTLSLLTTLHSILETFESQVRNDSELLGACRLQLVPGLLRALMGKDDFSVMVYALRVCNQLLRSFARELQDELQQVLSYLISAMDRDASPPWKRALCLEFFEKLCSDFRLLRQTYMIFDQDTGNAKIISNLMAALVRLAGEDLALIGHGRQSTMPIQRGANGGNGEFTSLEGQGVDIALASVEPAESKASGISMDWSILATPLLDQTDISTMPTIPGTYLFTLIIGCISSFSDGLSKFIMPLSVTSRREVVDLLESKDEDIENGSQGEDTLPKPRRSTTASHKYQRLVNPLTSSNPQQRLQVQVCCDMIDNCWPPALAICSIFLSATLDSHFYHQLIRSIQKLAQVSGILELATPRDAFLTSLAKASVPASNTATRVASQTNPSSSGVVIAENDKDVIKSPVLENVQYPGIAGRPSLNIRHLLCLRALLNLGIALGPTLEQKSWFIIVETMYQVDILLASPMLTRPVSSAGASGIGMLTEGGQSNLGAEVNAVNTATKKMIESTRSYSEESFTSVVTALFDLMGESQPGRNGYSPSDTALSSGSLPTAAISKPSHQPSRSISGYRHRAKDFDAETAFVLSKFNELSRVNIHRFASIESQSCSWNLIVSNLLNLAKAISLDGNLRLRSSSLVDLIAIETIKQIGMQNQNLDDSDHLQCICLLRLLEQVKFVQSIISRSPKTLDVEVEMHKRALESLEEILSQSGESLSTGWRIVFDILNVTFQNQRPRNNVEAGDQAGQHNVPIVPVAFRCMQLIASDFLTILDRLSLYKLTSLMIHFGTQATDVNMALTTTNLLRGTTLLVLERTDTIDLNDEDFLMSVDVKEEEYTYASIWSIALKLLTDMCTDERRDVRDATLRIVLQVLEAASERFTSHSWQIILETTFFSTIQSFRERLHNKHDDPIPFFTSFAQLITGMTDLMDENIQVITLDPSFTKTWSIYIDTLRGVLDEVSLVLQELTFSSLSKLLKALSRIKNNDEHLIRPALQLWAEQIQYNSSDFSSQKTMPLMSNQSALQARASLLVEAYRISTDATEQFSYQDVNIGKQVMAFVREVLTTASHPPYSSDIKKLAPEQEQVVEILLILKDIMKDDTVTVTMFFLELIKTALFGRDQSKPPPTSASSTKSVQLPTCIAFVSSSIDILRIFVLEHASNKNLVSELSISQSLSVLSGVINTKYTNIPTNAEAPLWRNATSTAVVLMETASANEAVLDRKKSDSNSLNDLSLNMVAANSSILGCGGLKSKSPSPSDQVITDDEEFDVLHFRKFHLSAISIIGNQETSEATRKNYVISIMNASLIAEPWYFDFPDSEELLNKPLTDFNTIRPGSVHRPIFPRRQRVAYAALDALFDLLELRTTSSAGNRASDRQIIAQTAAPYLLLRIAHPLKTFLADQRLRSLTPHPMPQQKEIHYILHKCLDLRCDNKAFTEGLRYTQNSNSDNGEANDTAYYGNDGKAHLRALYPLILRVLRYWNTMPRLKGQMAWQADMPGREIESALQKWIDVVGAGDGWGVGS